MRGLRNRRNYPPGVEPHRPTMLLEVCADSLASVVAAHAGGARRIELCSGLVDGGVTPSIGLVSAACSTAALLSPPMPIMVLIRARGGDFVYTADEVTVMLHDVAAVAAAGAAGVVLGALDAQGGIDMDAMHRLIAAARKHELLVTFHRAIDMTPDLIAAFAVCLELGVDRVLTSGGCNTAAEGAATIKQMVAMAVGTNTIVLPGAGVTECTVAA